MYPEEYNYEPSWDLAQGGTPSEAVAMGTELPFDGMHTGKVDSPNPKGDEEEGQQVHEPLEHCPRVLRMLCNDCQSTAVTGRGWKNNEGCWAENYPQ